MKKILTLVIALLTITSFAQTENQVDLSIQKEKYTAHNKGKFFFYWGGNRAYYSTSDIRFTGADYDFTLNDVTAHDRPKGYHLDFINPSRMTIPQTNFRMGYFINDHYNISIGWDHMKYVMYQNKVVRYSGNYPNEGTFDESLPGNELLLTDKFLTFEHTDGLNYIHPEITRVDDISKWFNLPNTDKFQINLSEGFGAGVLLPKTNTKLFDKERYDEFHLSGFGISAKAGLTFTFFKHYFIQTELKTGYIEMNDIRTTFDSADKAQQNFWFFQNMIAFGGIFKI
ncbi:hypothetical protein [Flavobacterium sp.]|jgi:hypothetical protein|uniref:hypothetical protein n=1 Tax=Flavobacterium sp. TaxID=239 RepID=UPI0037C11288